MKEKYIIELKSKNYHFKKEITNVEVFNKIQDILLKEWDKEQDQK